jgi:hypothetical protein
LRPSYRSIKRFLVPLFFYRYFRVPKNIKKGITNKIIPVFEVWKLSTMLCILKVIQTHVLKKIAQTSSIENKLSNHEPICMDSTILTLMTYAGLIH